MLSNVKIREVCDNHFLIENVWTEAARNVMTVFTKGKCDDRFVQCVKSEILLPCSGKPSRLPDPAAWRIVVHRQTNSADKALNVAVLWQDVGSEAFGFDFAVVYDQNVYGIGADSSPKLSGAEWIVKPDAYLRMVRAVKTGTFALACSAVAQE